MSAPAGLGRLWPATLCLLVLLLGACTVYWSPHQTRWQSVISYFSSERGDGAVYRPGEGISFVLGSERSGFVSLIGTDSTGESYVLGRNLPVRVGDNQLSGPTRQTRFAVVPPLGRHVVRLYFSEQRVPEARTSEAAIAARALDLVATSFVVRQR